MRVLVDENKDTHVIADNHKALLVNNRLCAKEIILIGNNSDISSIKEISIK